MQAFWWFKNDLVAGMARPGCNAYRWFDLEFDEAILMSWLGLHGDGEIELTSFFSHLKSYIPKVGPFYNLSAFEIKQKIDLFSSSEWILKTAFKLKKRTAFIKDLDISSNSLFLTTDQSQLQREIGFLNFKGIKQIVTLTEKQHSKETLENYFLLHHLSIEDMGTPQKEQVRQLAQILETAEINNEKVAVHCLAGIGRTSTMLMGAYLLRGQKLPDLLEQIKLTNPSFRFIGAQADFINKLFE